MSAEPDRAQEAVAWRVRYRNEGGAWGDWFLWGFEPSTTIVLKGNEREIEPLYRRADPQEGSTRGTDAEVAGLLRDLDDACQCEPELGDPPCPMCRAAAALQRTPQVEKGEPDRRCWCSACLRGFPCATGKAFGVVGDPAPSAETREPVAWEVAGHDYLYRSREAAERYAATRQPSSTEFVRPLYRAAETREETAAVEGGPMRLTLCEAGRVIPHVGRLYEFYVGTDCDECARLAAAYDEPTDNASQAFSATTSAPIPAATADYGEHMEPMPVAHRIEGVVRPAPPMELEWEITPIEDPIDTLRDLAAYKQGWDDARAANSTYTTAGSSPEESGAATERDALERLAEKWEREAAEHDADEFDRASGAIASILIYCANALRALLKEAR